MASLREVRRRIKSIKSTAQITKAMQLVSAAKMRKAQEAALGGKAYNRVMHQVLAHMAGKIDATKHPLLANRSEGDATVLFFSTDRGLAGALSSNLFRIAEHFSMQANYITVGRKGRDYVVKTQKNLEADFPIPQKPDFLTAKSLARIALDDFISGKVTSVHILYTDFINTIKQEPKMMQLLPITQETFASLVAEAQKEQSKRNAEPAEFLFEPNIDELLDFVLHHYIEMTLYQALLEASASEHSARMVAMKNATDNALELASDLTLEYNRARQDAITKELLDITTAALTLS